MTPATTPVNATTSGKQSVTPTQQQKQVGQSCVAAEKTPSPKQKMTPATIPAKANTSGKLSVTPQTQSVTTAQQQKQVGKSYAAAGDSMVSPDIQGVRGSPSTSWGFLLQQSMGFTGLPWHYGVRQCPSTF